MRNKYGNYIGQNKKVKSIFANVNGEKKSISSVWVNKDDIPTKVFSTNKSIPKIVSWSDGTDEEIVSMLEAHYTDQINIGDYWNVGDERKIQLSEIKSNNLEYQPSQLVTFTIIGFDHDTLKTSINGHNKAAVSVHMKGVFSNDGKMDVNENVCAWIACLRRTWCENNFRNSLPTVLNNSIKTVVKHTVLGNNTPNTISESYDNCWLFSCTEIDPYENNGNEGITYPYYDSMDKLINHMCWFRSPYYKYKGQFYAAIRSQSAYSMFSKFGVDSDSGISVGFAL